MLKRPGAFWVTSWPFAEFTKHEWAGSWVCSAFRRESGPQASALITSALAATVWRWQPPSTEWAMVTFVDRAKVKPTRVRGVDVWGWCYLRAGFQNIGETKGGLLALGIAASDLPAPDAPLGVTLELCIPWCEPGCSPRETADDAENLNDSEAGYRIRTDDIQLGKQARSQR